MKPSHSLSKKIVSGLMASVVLIAFSACNNADKRGVKARLNNKANEQKQQAIDRETKCSDEILQIVKDRDKSVNDITQLLNISKNTPLNDNQKDQLQSLVEDLKKQTDDFANKIKNLKSPNGKEVTGCYKENATNPSQKHVYHLSQLKSQNLALAQQVKAITNKTNEILDQAAQESREAELQVTAVGQKYLVSKLLADVLVSENKDGQMYLTKTLLRSGEGAAEELQKILQEKRSSVCYLEAASGRISENDELAVAALAITPGASEDKSVENATENATLAFQGEGDRMFVLACQLKVTESSAKELRDVLTQHFELLVQQKDSANDNAEEASAPAQERSPDAADSSLPLN